MLRLLASVESWKCRHCIPFGVPQRVGIPVYRQGNGRVPHEALRGFGMHAARRKQGSRRVSQAVEVADSPHRIAELEEVCPLARFGDAVWPRDRS
jgi:hypothetical protein